MTTSHPRGTITPVPKLAWPKTVKKKPTNAVSDVIDVVKQVAETYPGLKRDFAEEYRHMANLLLADNTLAQLRKIESARILAEKLEIAIEQDDEEILLLM